MAEFNIKFKDNVGLKVTEVPDSDNAVINKKYFSDKLDEFHSLSSTKDFSDLELPSTVYYKVIEPEWVSTTRGESYEIKNIKYTKVEKDVWFYGRYGGTNYLTVPENSSYTTFEQSCEYSSGDYDSELPTIVQLTSYDEKVFLDENSKKVLVYTYYTGCSSETGETLCYITTYKYEDGSPLTTEEINTFYLYEFSEVYDFENFQFTTEAEGNTLLGDVFTYKDEWENTCYTLYPDYTPNIKPGASVTKLEANNINSDPENMLYSIKLEALYNGGYKYSLANKEFSYLGGSDVIADGNGALASGRDSYAIGNSANTLGRQNKVRAQSGVALGYNNTVTGRHGVALNEGNKVLGYAALGAGDHNTVGGAYDIVSGWQNKTRGSANIVQGSKNNVNAELTLCQGSTNEVEGNTLANFGNHNVVRGGFSIVQGYKNNTDGQYLAVTGNNNKVTGVSSIVTGGSNIVEGTGYNGVVGATNTINGSENFVVGYKNNVNAVRAIVSGASNTVETGSNYSLVVGMSNITKSRFANAIGAGLTADGSYSQLVVGRNNVVESDAHFIVGNGVTTDSKSNAFVVHYDGRATVGKNPERNMDVSTKYYVDSKTSGLASKSYVDTQIANNIGSSVFVSDTAPTGTHKKGTLWIDTSENDGGLKYYNGTSWTTVPVRFS